MNILLIGNGFDLAHNLPTTYNDFLDFCKLVKEIYSQKDFIDFKNFISDFEINRDIMDLLENPIESRELSFLNVNNSNQKIETTNQGLNEIIHLINKNIWIEYFLNFKNCFGKNWIDFESEISKIIQILDEIKVIKKQGNSYSNKLKEGKTHVIKEIIEIIKVFSSLKIFDEKFEDILLEDDFVHNIKNLLYHDLEKLIRALEIYLTYFVEEINNNITVNEINNLEIDHVLSFNYTNTFCKKYDDLEDIKYTFIHGEADLKNTIESNNMVLGIDEYLSENRKDKEFTFLSFKKFYQRLLKSTDNSYLDWADEIKDGYEEYLKKDNDIYVKIKDSFKNGSATEFPFPKSICADISDTKCPEHTLYIFGHSLDVTDKDILKLFILNDNVQTKIFYYQKSLDDKSVLGKLITNLIGIIGQDELIRRTGGLHKTIEFIPQSIM